MDDRETPVERIERLVTEGEIPREAVERAVHVWREQNWDQGISIPNGERITVSGHDLMHVIIDLRVWRKPERIESALSGIFELRTALFGRRKGLARWIESDAPLAGYVILMPDNSLRALHLTSERKLKKEQRKGELLWTR